MDDASSPRPLAPLWILVPVARAAGKIELHDIHPPVAVDVQREVDERVAVPAMHREGLHWPELVRPPARSLEPSRSRDDVDVAVAVDVGHRGPRRDEIVADGVLAIPYRRRWRRERPFGARLQLADLDVAESDGVRRVATATETHDTGAWQRTRAVDVIGQQPAVREQAYLAAVRVERMIDP